MKIHAVSAALVAALALAGTAHAQSSSTTPDSGSSTAPAGTMSNDVNGSTTMPAEVVPGSVNASGTSSAQDTVRYVPDTRIPMRSEVKAEAASMARSGLIPHGELSTAYQDKGAQLGSTPY
jgi:hypothetical protein